MYVWISFVFEGAFVFGLLWAEQVGENIEQENCEHANVDRSLKLHII